MAEDTGETQWVNPRRPVAPPWNRARGIALFCHVYQSTEAIPVADESSLRFIGLTLGAITGAVTLIAAMLVLNVDRSAFERPATTAVIVTSAG
jgi:hypothetical protein